MKNYQEFRPQSPEHAENLRAIVEKLYQQGFRLKALPEDPEWYVLSKNGEELGSGLLNVSQNRAELFELLGLPLSFDDTERDNENKQPILQNLIELSLKEE